MDSGQVRPSDAAETVDIATQTRDIPSGFPRIIGSYHIKHPLGSGGMGAVYLAVQDKPKRTVALKIIRADVASPAALRRFEYESQVLARLRHPGIAQIYEAGAHDAGHGPMPFFAMEYIAGATTITEHARLKKLSVADRVQLFMKVCDAVHYGHQKGIIHRDLKPGNILIDSAGWPKIIDFGLARGTDADLAGATLQTNLGQLVGTLQYMSPEQCQGDPHNVDVRSDVYSLGVVLYELLAGKYPYDVSTTSVIDAARVICAKAPTPLGSHVGALRGDLETIAGKCLEKDRDQRYQSVADLSADLDRFLKDEPILARPIGIVARARKWVRRHREISIVGGVALVLITAISTYLIVRLVAARRDATANWRVAEENLKSSKDSFRLVRKLLEFRDLDGQSLLEQGNVNAAKLLDSGAESMILQRPESPATEADFREVLGVGYTELGAIEKGRAHLERALEIRRELDPKPNSLVADALHYLAVTYYRDGDFTNAKRLYVEAHEMRRLVFQGDHHDLAQSLTHLAACELKLGDAQAARGLYEQALEMRQRLADRMTGADETERKKAREDIAASLNNIGRVQQELGDFTAAENSFRQALNLVREIRGEDHINVAYACHNLAACLLERGRNTEARDLFTKALTIRRGHYGESHSSVGTSRMGLARALLGLDELDDAEEEARAGIRILMDTLPREHPDLSSANEILGRILVQAGRPADAEPVLREAVAICERARVAAPFELAQRRNALGVCLLSLKRYQEAESMLVQSYEGLRAERGEKHPLTLAALEKVVELYRATDQPKADGYAKRLEDARR